MNKKILSLAILGTVLSVALAWAAGETTATFGIQSGSNPRNLCVFDLSSSRPCLPIGSIDSVTHTYTPVTTGGQFPGGGSIPISPPGGRLTLTSGQPVQQSDVSAGTHVYYTPYIGNGISIWNGVTQVGYLFTELTQTLDSNTGHTGYQAANSNYDEFIIADSATNPATVRLCTGPAWTSDTARGSGASTTELEYKLGLLVNKQALNCKWGSGASDYTAISVDQGTYVGTIRTWTSAGQVTNRFNPGGASGGILAQLGVWNNYNQVQISALVQDTGTSYNYTSATYRIARASANNKITYVSGQMWNGGIANYKDRTATAAVSGAFCHTAIGFDVTNAPYISIFSLVFSSTTDGAVSTDATTVLIQPQLGFHYVAAIEDGDGTNACNFNAAGNGVLQFQIAM